MSEHDNGWDFAKRLSEALLKVRPLGGSELFVKRNNQYYADPDYCGRMIDEIRDSLNQEIRSRIKLERALEAVVRDVNDYEKANNLAPNPGRSECWDSVARAKALLEGLKAPVKGVSTP